MKLKKAFHIFLFTLGTLFFVLFTLWGLDALFPPYLKRFQDTSPFMTDHQGETLCVLLSKDEQKRLPISPSQVSARYLRFLIACEDQRFYHHWGVDFLALGRAVFQRISQGHVVSGGSTLTMQTARLLEPRPRTILSKCLEICRAFQLEYHYSKEEILSFYLTLAPFGGNIEGLYAASFIYFNQSPQELTDGQAALLVALPQSPTALRPHRYPQKAQLARSKILSRLKKMGLLTQQETQEAEESSLPLTQNRFPTFARHLLQDLLQRYPNQRSFKTTLKRPLQEYLETLLKREAFQLESEASLAALVVENETGSILAYSGSALFHDEKRQGQINLIRAVRSPGSALKPAIYALAFQDQILHPETLIDDKEIRFSGYHPKNFHDTFHGSVSIREALQQSLNVPAVAVLDKIGPGRFLDILRHAGIQLILKNKDKSASLPIALGGLGTTLLDLVTLYTSFSCKGNMIVPHDLQGVESKIVPLFTPTAAWYITHILQESPAPEYFVDWRVTHQNAIAYKTGTSYGYRDGWAIGYTPSYTVGVWAGRADGLFRLGSTARKSSVPILFKIFSFLPTNKTFLPESPPQEALLATQAELPLGLQYFRIASEKKEFLFDLRKTSPLAISFPLPGTRIHGFDAHKKTASPLTFTATGGVRPLKWLVNGQLVFSAPFSRSTTWTPDSRGFTRIMVIDNEGQIAHIDIEIF